MFERNVRISLKIRLPLHSTTFVLLNSTDFQISFPYVGLFLFSGKGLVTLKCLSSKKIRSRTYSPILEKYSVVPDMHTSVNLC